MKNKVLVAILFATLMSVGNAYGYNYADGGDYTYPEEVSRECTEEYTQGTKGEGVFQEWNVSIWSRTVTGPFGRRFLSDETHTVSIDNVYTETCVYTYDDGSTETYTWVEYQGHVVGLEESLVSVYIDYDNDTNLPIYEITLGIPERRGYELEIVYGTIYQTFSGTLEGYADGYIPTADGRVVRYRGQMDVSPQANGKG